MNSSVPMSDTVSPDYLSTCDDEVRELSWEELDNIIDKLPEGYGTVFRLAVLDGLSHKEIAEQLGIAPHSSSSQLSRAKAMLRQFIMQYRKEMGILSIIGLVWLIWQGLYKHRVETPYIPILSNNNDTKSTVAIDTIIETDSSIDSIVPHPKLIRKIVIHPDGQQNIANAPISNDTIRTVNNDSTSNDTISIIQRTTIRGELIAQNDVPNIRSNETHDWSLSLAYTGSFEQNDINRYFIPNPDCPDVEGPSDEIEITEKTRHYMPLVIGLSINKPLTSRWNVETGVRYTYLRSDYSTESTQMKKETIQRIHYIGIPLKLSYRIMTINGFSIYGQGGGAFDIPIYGTQHLWEYSPQFETKNKDIFNIHAPFQWSVEGGLGIQFHVTPSFSFYAEPSLRYYFNPGSDIKTIRQDKQFEFTIPIGLRWTW